jgi:hypothetical protein
MKSRIAIPAALALVVVVAGMIFFANKGGGRRPHVVDGVIYEPTEERLVLAVQATSPEGQTEEWSLDLNLGIPAFTDLFRKGPTTYAVGGQCRPMLTGQYMLDISLNTWIDTVPPKQAVDVAWKGAVQLWERYSANSPNGGAITFTLAKPSKT